MAVTLESLEEKVDKLAAAVAKLEENAGKANDQIGETNSLLGSSVLKMKNITVESGKFVTNLSAQYKLAEGLAEVSKKTAVNIGISVGRSGEFTKVFNQATTELTKFGGKAEDTSAIMERFADESGRARIINADEVKNIFLLEKGLGVASHTATDMM